VLELSNVSASIAGVSVLRKISAQIARSSTVAIVGRNGAGKTTLLRIIMGFVPHSAEGRVLLDGRDLSRFSSHDRPRLGIGYGPEDRVLFPSFTVEENLRFPCEVIRMSKKVIDRRQEEVLSIVPELNPLLGRSGAVLSGGQAKMAVLGRSLMVGTRLVLLDEPFQGLAPVLAVQYTESLNRLHAARPELTILITESNRSLLKDIPNVTWTLERGAMTADVDVSHSPKPVEAILTRQGQNRFDNALTNFTTTEKDGTQ
jgi:ABC-type branched-subunit amino acid transport system ATPase component